MITSGREQGPKFGSGLVLLAELALFCPCSQNVSDQCLAPGAICSKVPTHHGTSLGSRVILNLQFLPFISSCHNWNIKAAEIWGLCVLILLYCENVHDSPFIIKM